MVRALMLVSEAAAWSELNEGKSSKVYKAQTKVEVRAQLRDLDGTSKKSRICGRFM